MVHKKPVKSPIIIIENSTFQRFKLEKKLKQAIVARFMNLVYEDKWDRSELSRTREDEIKTVT